MDVHKTSILRPYVRFTSFKGLLRRSLVFKFIPFWSIIGPFEVYFPKYVQKSAKRTSNVRPLDQKWMKIGRPSDVRVLSGLIWFFYYEGILLLVLELWVELWLWVQLWFLIG